MLTYGTVHCEDEHHEEEGEVTSAVVLREHEDETPDKHDGNWVEEEPEAIADSITQERMKKRPDDHEDVWWSCK